MLDMQHFVIVQVCNRIIDLYIVKFVFMHANKAFYAFINVAFI